MRNAHLKTQIGVLHVQNRETFQKQLAVNDAVFDDFGQTEAIELGHFFKITENGLFVAGVVGRQFVADDNPV